MTTVTNQSVELQLLATAGRLLLEYNDSTEDIERTLAATARAMNCAPLTVAVSYNGISVSVGEGPQLMARIHELRYNAALQAHIHSILVQLRRGNLDPSQALAALEEVESHPWRHSRWIAVSAIGIAAAALASLLGADVVACIGSGISTAIGLVARQELGRRHFSVLTLPFVAAFIGAVIGATAARFGLTQTPELMVVVPSLMIVPGPHFINGLTDLIDNHVPMALARLGLAGGVLLASSAGIVLGMSIVPYVSPIVDGNIGSVQLTLPVDVLLAGIVTSGFAIFYNVPLSQLGLAVFGGMLGHGLRYVALDFGWSLGSATFFGSFAIGIVSAFIARSYQVPVAVIAFAGAVTMMPGIQIFQSLRGCLQLAYDATNHPLAASTIGDMSQAVLVVAALALGLIVGIRVVWGFLNNCGIDSFRVDER